MKRCPLINEECIKKSCEFYEAGCLIKDGLKNLEKLDEIESRLSYIESGVDTIKRNIG